MYYYACIGEYKRDKTRTVLRQPLCICSEQELTDRIVVEALKASYLPPFGFKFVQLFFIYKFTKDPRDYEGCMSDYLYDDPGTRADIACFLMDFNCMDENERDNFFAFLS